MDLFLFLCFRFSLFRPLVPHFPPGRPRGWGPAGRGARGPHPAAAPRPSGRRRAGLGGKRERRRRPELRDRTGGLRRGCGQLQPGFGPQGQTGGQFYTRGRPRGRRPWSSNPEPRSQVKGVHPQHAGGTLRPTNHTCRPQLHTHTQHRVHIRTMDIYVTVVHTPQHHTHECTLQADMTLLAHTSSSGGLLARLGQAMGSDDLPASTERGHGKRTRLLSPAAAIRTATQSSAPLDKVAGLQRWGMLATCLAKGPSSNPRARVPEMSIRPREANRTITAPRKQRGANSIKQARL